MKNLSIGEIEELRKLILENAEELSEEASILFNNKKYARAYTLSHLASEELAKLPILSKLALDLINGKDVNWKKIDKKLNSHTEKLKGLLFSDLLGTDINPSEKNITVHEKTISRIQILNDLKNVSLYAGKYQDSLYKPNAAITASLASQSLEAINNRLSLFSNIEAHTNGRISDLANNQRYMELLHSLGVGNDS